MNIFTARLFTNWHLIRMVKLGIGIMLLVQGIHGKDWAYELFSVFFILQAVTDTGFCGTKGCYYKPFKINKYTIKHKNERIIEY